MPKQELLVEVKKLISIGKEKGFLTYDELNSTLPAEVVSSEQFGSIMSMFGEMDIEIVDAPDGERQQKVRSGDHEDGGDEADEGDSNEENEKEIDQKNKQIGLLKNELNSEKKQIKNLQDQLKRLKEIDLDLEEKKRESIPKIGQPKDERP